MKVTIKRGIGQPGKLWTGSRDFFPGADLFIPGLEHTSLGKAEGFGDRVVEVNIIENWSVSGATTRRLWVVNREVTFTPEEAALAPVLYIGTGGVGSLPDPSAGLREEDLALLKVALWNWSGRIGGFAILNPITVLSGYYSQSDLRDLPKVTEEFKWVQTYAGNVVSEYVLLEFRGGNLHPRHIPPFTIWPKATLSPPEKKRLEETFRRGIRK
ncbi:MAG: hypothetical protein WC847_01400 [Candidatus Paceibacterota bacterium]|jgi:hypothetical protein